MGQLFPWTERLISVSYTHDRKMSLCAETVQGTSMCFYALSPQFRWVEALEVARKSQKGGTENVGLGGPSFKSQVPLLNRLWVFGPILLSQRFHLLINKLGMLPPTSYVHEEKGRI